MDLFTLHMASALTNVTCCVVLSIAGILRNEQRYFRLWASAFLVFAIGLVLQIGGERHPALGALTYGCLVAGVLLLLSGFRVFDGNRAFNSLMYGSLPIPSATYLVAEAIAPGTDWPQTLTFLVSCVISAQAPIYVLRVNSDRLLFRWVAGATMAFQSIATISVVMWAPGYMDLAHIGVAISLSDQVCSTVVIASVLGMVMERSNRRLDALVHQDALTGCLNRAGLLAYKKAAKGPAAVLVADLDHFKRLNDRYGHAAGDEALREFVRRAKSILPKSGVIARSGGEEFVIILPGAGEGEARQAAWRLCEAVGGKPVNWAGDALSMTVSVGVSSVRENEAFREAILRADEALYRAKEAGRNQVKVFGEASGGAKPPGAPLAGLAQQPAFRSIAS